MKNYFIIALLALLVATGCGSHNVEDSLRSAAEVADSVAKADAGGSVVVDVPNLQISFTVTDSEISLASVGQDLFEVFAAQQLKKVSPKVVAKVVEALRESKGELDVIINSDNGESAAFTLTPHRIVALQRAKNSELNFSSARTQVIAVAERMVPAPQEHIGAMKVHVSVSKSFLEYNIVWPNVTSYERQPQGILTKRYFNALKEQYQTMGGLAEPVIDMLTSMGIDGVRIVYSAENSDKELKQAFPWREIRLPIEKE